METLEQWMGLKSGTLSGIILDVSTRILIALVILIIGFWIAKQLSKTMERVMKRRNTDASLVGFLKSLTSISLKILVVITAITQLGIEMTSFVAILGGCWFGHWYGFFWYPFQFCWWSYDSFYSNHIV